MGHLQVDYRDKNRLRPSEDSSLDSVISVVVPIIICLSIIILFLLINQKKQWVPLLCWYRTPTKVSFESLSSAKPTTAYTPFPSVLFIRFLLGSIIFILLVLMSSIYQAGASKRVILVQGKIEHWVNYLPSAGEWVLTSTGPSSLDELFFLTCLYALIPAEVESSILIYIWSQNLTTSVIFILVF